MVGGWIGVMIGLGAEVTLTSPYLEFRLDSDSGRYSVVDRRSGVVWFSDPTTNRFGRIGVWDGAQIRTLSLRSCSVEEKDGQRLFLRFEVGLTNLPIRMEIPVQIRLIQNGQGLEFSAAPPPRVQWIRLLDRAFWMEGTDPTAGMALPVREGLWVPARGTNIFSHTFGTYTHEGCHMAMAGLVRQGSAILITWKNPYVDLVVERRRWGTNTVRLFPSLVLSKSAHSICLSFLGRGNYVQIAKAYRPIAQERGFWVPWSEKVRKNPKRRRLFGAVDFKLWSLLSRRMDYRSTHERSKRVNWTFDEAAAVARHLREDLKLDRVLFVIGGWIHRGYDNQHPDILPAAPECGGNEGLRRCAETVRECGYLFCLHDNYQDMYRDAPSWNEYYIAKRPDGSLTLGGYWAGGRAYIICSKTALELAQRPQNLPAVYELTHADAYFIDTTFASSLRECYDPRHLMTRLDDIYWKSALCDYARGLFGIFGSEDGREWGIPHADFFEGLCGVKGQRFSDMALQRKLEARPIPLFELVYRECIAVYGKYGFRPIRADSAVLWHMILGRPFFYHGVPPHRYWMDQRASIDAGSPSCRVTKVEILGPYQIRIHYQWRTIAKLHGRYRVFVHFTDLQGRIRFMDDHDPPIPTTDWPTDRPIQWTRTVRIPPYAPQRFQLRVGLWDRMTGRRVSPHGKDDGNDRIILGEFQRQNGQFQWIPARQETQDLPIFVRGDGGWPEGLVLYDRFVKNTYEVLSPLHELTAEWPMVAYRWLTSDGQVQESRFQGPNGQQIRVVVNFGTHSWQDKSRWLGPVTLGHKCFLIEGDTFLAYRLTEVGGVFFEDPGLWTLRSLDGKPLDTSAQVRVYHGFGDNHLWFRNRWYQIRKERILP